MSPGSRYAYRLAYNEAGVEVFAAETWVEVPSAMALALEGFRPNPAVDAPAVSFELPTGADAQLELLDLAGRRIYRREVGALGPGRHLVRIGDAGPLAAGAYWVRLTQAGRSLVTKGVVVR